MLATAAMLGVLSATAGLAGRRLDRRLATGSAAAARSPPPVRAVRVFAKPVTSRPCTPADWITLTRAVLAAGVAGLVADSFSSADAGNSADHLVHHRAGTRTR